MTEFRFDTDTAGQQIMQSALAMRMEQAEPVTVPPEPLVAEEFPAVDLPTLRQQAEALAADLGRKPRKPDYIAAARRGKVANYISIQRLIGGVTALNAEIGFPDYSSWRDEEFINYGVTFTKTNGIDYLVPDVLDIVARRGRGPWCRSAAMRFGSWSAYKEEIYSTLQLALEAEIARDNKLAHYTALQAAGQLPDFMDRLDGDELLSAAGKYRVINDCAADIAPSVRDKLVLRRSQSFIKGILDHKPELNHGYIEMIAATHGVFDDIWPPAAPEQIVRPEHILVTEEEIAELRARRIASDRKRQPRSHKSSLNYCRRLASS